jgi:hypothetical protein
LTVIEKANSDVFKFLIEKNKIDIDDDYFPKMINGPSDNIGSKMKKVKHCGVYAVEAALKLGKADVAKYLANIGAELTYVIDYKLKNYDCVYDAWNCIDDDDVDDEDYMNDKYDELRKIRSKLHILITNVLNGVVDATELNIVKFNTIDAVWILRHLRANDISQYLNNDLFYKIIVFCYNKISMNF